MRMPLYLIGLGLGDAKDITLRGLEIVKRASSVYLEHYTAILNDTLEEMEQLYERKVIIADREFIEQQCDGMLEEARTNDVCMLVVGDVFCATTHCDIYLRAVEKGVQVHCIHNAGIMTAVGISGLSLYNFGRTVSVVFFTDSWHPSSFYDKMGENLKNELHTLCLLDIKVKEQSIENIVKGRKIYEPPRYMTVNQAIEQLLWLENEKKQNIFNLDTLCIGLTRVGSPDQRVIAGTAEQLLKVDFGPPLHSLIVPHPGQISEMEMEMINHWRIRD
ncbi:putative Diphthine methyl ester synthase [Blattamonas nauphoetae]|uniref:diphthine methyl ester synthase n=1 Tax=Blattamonas nauphoetae TaxID=2049346 RepID=A0ABQ9YFP2_9EUKA|nr:putative Diphthine methyl ester synthase [Blattamonas nauphoetae]